MAEFTYDEIKEYFREALEMLYNKEKRLIEISISERLLVHYLAIYFEKIVKKYRGNISNLNVDVEYNRKGDENTSKNSPTTNKCCTIDMILHERTCPDNNILCVEAKWRNNKYNIKSDRERVKALMKKSNNEKVPQYMYGVCVVFGINSIKCCYFNRKENKVISENIKYKLDTKQYKKIYLTDSKL